MERTDQTLDKLRRLIADGGADAEGRMPPERVLATDLGVGRRSLRRALDILEQEGRIQRHQGRGTFVQPQAGRAQAGRASGMGASGMGASGMRAIAVETGGPISTLGALHAIVSGDHMPGLALEHILDHTNPLEVIEVRLAIEPVMARLAAFRASQADIKRLQGLVSDTKSATNSADYELADAKFHRTIAEAARNALFLAIFDTLHASQRDAGWRRLGENAHCYKRQSVHADFHREICEAISARQGERAQDVMCQHLNDVQRHIYRHAFPDRGTEQ